MLRANAAAPVNQGDQQVETLLEPIPGDFRPLRTHLPRLLISPPPRPLGKSPAMRVSGDTSCLSASQASHRVPGADPRQVHVYYNGYYTS